ncbi:ATP-binding cassette subfamily B protein [Actinocorallia herbida]|uniref:ATP-binding cassette subfamily B protein n=1 Tax=Actinocorallia herbida TaxID=58109 RepID=A0A3N1D2N5_9ACTN|nr:ABC transporter ATP-binding protein [Actinocorallia herbida]ROO87338.1 ATP-binding cassette subfamily B protein [Actinocorallia herbida]
MLLRLLPPLLRPHRRALAAITLLQLAQSVAALALPDLGAALIDDGVLQDDQGFIWRTAGWMAAAALVQLACAAGAVVLAARVAAELAGRLRTDLFAHVQGWSARETARFGAASLLTRTTNDVQQVQTLVQLTLSFMVTAPLMCAGGVVFALAQDLPLSLLILVLTPVLGGSVLGVLRAMTPVAVRLQRALDGVNRILREQIAGQRVIRAFVREEHERDRFAAANASYTTESLRLGRLMALLHPVVTAVAGVTGAAVVWFGAGRVEAGAIGPGALSAFLGYVLQILGAAIMSTYLLQQWPRAQVCAARLREVLDTPTSVPEPAHPVREFAAPGRVELRGAGFGYLGAQEPVLRDIDLVAEPGRTVAVIGGTGSGKSTLLSLLVRLADVTEGAALIGGADVRDLDRATLSRAVGHVPQRAFLFAGTVASNLRFGAPDASDADLWRALEVAQARDFVAALPGGLDSAVAAGGTNFSGGQRQRLTIARAIAAKPAVLLFDDSFSALDSATEARLRAALARETAGTTVIVVAQRVGSIRDADRIVVLDAGRVAGTGTHAELLAANPVYREIVLSQRTEAEAA